MGSANVVLASWTGTPTKHVPSVVLATSLVSDVSLNPQPDQGQVFDNVFVRVDSTNDAEPFAIMNIMTKLV